MKQQTKFVESEVVDAWSGQPIAIGEGSLVARCCISVKAGFSLFGRAHNFTGFLLPPVGFRAALRREKFAASRMFLERACVCVCVDGPKQTPIVIQWIHERKRKETGRPAFSPQCNKTPGFLRRNARPIVCCMSLFSFDMWSTALESQWAKEKREDKSRPPSVSAFVFAPLK